MSARFEPLHLDVRAARRLAAPHGLESAAWTLVWLPVDDLGRAVTTEVLAPLTRLTTGLAFSGLAQRQASATPPAEGRVLRAEGHAQLHVPLFIGRDRRGSSVVVDACRGVVVVADVVVVAVDARISLVVIIAVLVVAVDAMRALLEMVVHLAVAVTAIVGMGREAAVGWSAALGLVAVAWFAWRLRGLAQRDLLGAFVSQVTSGARRDVSDVLRLLALLLGGYALVATGLMLASPIEGAGPIEGVRLVIQWSAALSAFMCARRAPVDVGPASSSSSAAGGPAWADTATLALRSLGLGSVVLLAVDVCSASGLADVVAGALHLRAPALSSVQGTVLQLVAIPIAATSTMPTRQKVPLLVALTVGIVMKLVAGNVGAFVFGAVAVFLGVMASEKDLRGAALSGLRFGSYAAAGRLVGAAAGGLLIGLPGASLGEALGEQVGGIVAATRFPTTTTEAS